MFRVKPSAVGVGSEKVGVSAASSNAADEVALTVLDPAVDPVLVEVMVTFAEVLAASPVTVTSPELFIVTIPPFVAVPDHP
jgi:hypothetical protein